MANKGEHHTGGRGGIRTHGTLAGTPVFKTGALNHSATLPLLEHQSLSKDSVKNGPRTKAILAPTWPQGRYGFKNPAANAVIAFDNDSSAFFDRFRLA